jgi:hypothetical protein
MAQRRIGERRIGEPGFGQPREPRFAAMIGLVALVVAVVILVFFGLGYLFGRVFV